jgi:DNA-binding CsgD family transcriptional regulator
VFFFTDELRSLAASVRAGTSAQVIASWGTGASTLLTALTRQLAAEDYAIVAVHGAAYARQIEYFALLRSDGLPSSPPPARTFATLLDLTTAALRRAPRSAIVIDALDQVDRGTLAVLQAAADLTGTPVVLSRSRDIRSLIGAGSHYSRFDGNRVELAPLDYVSTAALVHDKLGHWPDPEVASRLFAKSAGVAGLAAAIIAGATANGLIHLVEDLWTMTGPDLRSGDADSWIEAHLSLLTAPEFDLLDTVATGPRGHLDHRAPADPATRRALEGLGLLRPTAEEENQLSVHPPILADYLRRTLSSTARPPARSARSATPNDADRIEEVSSSPPHPASLSHTVSTFRHALECRVLERAREWTRSADVATALPYLAALMDIPRTERTIQSVFDTTRLSTATSAEDAFDFVHSYQQWAGQRRQTTRDDLDYVRVAESYPEWREAITLFTAHSHAGTAPARLDALPGGIRCKAAFAFIHLKRGELAMAREVMARVPASSHLHTEKLRNAIETVTVFAERDHPRIVSDSQTGIELAHREIDHGAILLHSYTQALSLAPLARWGEARSVITKALAFGPPGAASAGVYRALLFSGAFIELRSGDLPRAERLISEAEAMDVNVDETNLPSTQDEYSAILRQLVSGDPVTAMDSLRRLATRVHRLSNGRGSFAAEMALRVGMVLWPEESTLDQLEAVLTDSETPYSQPLHDIARLSFSSLSEAAEAAVHLDGLDEFGFLAQVIAGRIAQETEQGSDVPESTRHAVMHLGTLLHTNADHLERHPLDAAPVSVPGLTAREYEIALQVRTHSNAAIASRLGVSIRTVENHIHSAMKKRGAPTRFALYDQLGQHPR